MNNFKIKRLKVFHTKGWKTFFMMALKKVFKRRDVKKLADILDRLDAACLIEDMNYPGAQLQ
jgi:hypothetical protein